MNFFKFKKNKIPSVESARPPIFNDAKWWTVILTIFFVILFATTIAGFRLFHLVYTESYKKDISGISADEAISATKLKSLVDKRIELLDKKITLPNDPSM